MATSRPDPACRSRSALALILALLASFFIPACGGNSGPATAPPSTSTTAPAAPAATEAQNTATYTFAVCGDNRITGIENGTMDRIVASARERGAEFVVNTGDLTTTGSRDELARYREYTVTSGLKWFAVPGNHDVGSGGVSAAYEEVIGAYYYSFDYGGDNFVIVNNSDDRTGIDGAQRTWLSGDMAAGDAERYQFIFAHIPIASPSLGSGHATGESGGTGLESGQWLASEAARHPNVAALFFGHVHAYAKYDIDGLTGYVTGGAGAPLYFPESLGGYYHYLLVRVGPEAVEVEVVRV